MAETETVSKNVIKINKTHSAPRNSRKLGIALAAWKKLKASTNTPSSEEVAVAAAVDDEERDMPKNVRPESIIEEGPDGEIFVFHKCPPVLEIWDAQAADHDSASDTIYLQAQIVLGNDFQLRCFKIVEKCQGVYTMVAVVSVKTFDYIETYALEPGSITLHSSIALGFVSQSYELRANKSFACVGANDGYIHVFQIDSLQLHLKLGNGDSSMSGLQKNHRSALCDQKIANLKEDHVVIQTSTCGDCPIFDLVDGWLVYSPVQAEYKYLKAAKRNEKPRDSSASLKADLDPITTNYNSSQLPRQRLSIFTPMKLPVSAPLYNKVIGSLSKSALDGLFTLSKFSSSKYREYMNNELELNKISKSVGTALYTNIQKSSEMLKPNNNQIVTVLDLRNDKNLATFKPPGGVSAVSLSPYDMQLVTTNVRGDSLYMWDLFRLPKDISLIGKFARGQTAAVIKDIFWFNKDDGQKQRGSNFGFGCISKASGSVHWYSTDFLSDGDSGTKGPLSGKSSRSRRKSHDRPPTNWTLSSFGAEKFVNIFGNQLGVVNGEGTLKLIDASNGENFHEFRLPARAAKEFQNPESFTNTTATEGKESLNPISQAEIETCPPFLNLINRNNVEFATYTYNKEELNEFGSVIPSVPISVKSARKETCASLPKLNHGSEPSSEDENWPRLGQLMIDQDDDETMSD
ncbi:uncharacterized protein LODBEIA_P23580 [Lodderomyces beijingensis]|uniref:Uncharacterized protein n=1 Tax=Lodderomyces beijingensis TaxID=1775926 RepID=A0ABP0ZJT0_9ASCO